MTHITLYAYFRSSCSWRVRIALQWLQVPYELKVVNLLESEQHSVQFTQENASPLVPSLHVTEGSSSFTLGQSVAIMEYLEEHQRHSSRRLLPEFPHQRAIVRQMVQIIASDTQPLQNLRVLDYIHQNHQVDKKTWSQHWIQLGLDSYEKMLTQFSGKYSFGDQVTMADCCLVPQLYNARRFGLDVTQWPKCVAVEKELKVLDEFKVAHAHQQPDTLEELRGKDVC